MTPGMGKEPELGKEDVKKARTMSFVGLFIQRPIATTLLAIGLALAGATALFLLPVSPLPNIDIPTISVTASMAGASPEVMAETVATPLERHLGVIAAVTEMTSRSSLGSTQVVLQFDIDRNIDGAARDVQAAIVAAKADLPTALRSNPTYRKVNSANQPIVIIALTSKTLTPGEIYDQATNILEQKLSQISGVGDVTLNGATQPAIRVELNPRALAKYGLSAEDVRAAISGANANSPKGGIDQGTQRFQVYANDNADPSRRLQDLIVAYRTNTNAQGAAIRLSDVAQVYDGVENVRVLGIADGKPAILVQITQQPGANVIQVVDRIRALLPQLVHDLPPAVDLAVISDGTVSIRNSVRDVEETLVISTLLVVLTVFLFLRNFRATMVPAVSVPLALFGTVRHHVHGRLQPGQFFADGADRFDRLCRRQHHRRAGECHPPSGDGRNADGGGPERRPGSQLHRHLHEHFAHCGVLPDPADGRHCRKNLP